MSRHGKVIVAMSGGVDSSVAACLLKEQGYECVGVFMRVGVAVAAGASPAVDDGDADAGLGGPALLGGGHENAHASVPMFPRSRVPTVARQFKHACCSVSDALDARAIAGRFGIPFYVLNFQPDFERIIDYFVDEYARARTPNPCVVCNLNLKFGKLLRYADLLDAEFVATGHYARIVRRVPLLFERCGAQPSSRGRGTADTAVAPSDVFLARALNRAKDQSYVLFGIRREDLPRCLFPLGEIADKAEVRRIAAELGLRVHDKPDSQEICFVPDGDYKQLVRARRPETQRRGEIRDVRGNVLGTHDGVANYTIGQRRGLGIAAGKPIYVTKLAVLNNTVTVGPREDLLSTGLIAELVNWLTDPPPTGLWTPAEIKIRHRHTPVPGSIRASPPVAAGVSPAEVALAPCGRRGDVAAGASPAVDEQRPSGPTLEVRFDAPQSAVTPGQAAVFYRGDGVVLGGGWIARAVSSSE